MTYQRFVTAAGTALAATLLWQSIASAGSTVTGTWTTIDDATGQPKAIVEIEERGGLLYGKILKIYNPSRPNPTCDKCTDSRKGQPITGMTILTGLKPASADSWDHGEILDPKSGSTYRCQMHLLEGGKKLEVRGYIGISVLGRSQIWIRQ